MVKNLHIEAQNLDKLLRPWFCNQVQSWYKYRKTFNKSRLLIFSFWIFPWLLLQVNSCYRLTLITFVSRYSQLNSKLLKIRITIAVHCRSFAMVSFKIDFFFIMNSKSYYCIYTYGLIMWVHNRLFLHTGRLLLFYLWISILFYRSTFITGRLLIQVLRLL